MEINERYSASLRPVDDVDGFESYKIRNQIDRLKRQIESIIDQGKEVKNARSILNILTIMDITVKEGE